MNETLSTVLRTEKEAVNEARRRRMQGRLEEAISYTEGVKPFLTDPKARRRLLNNLGLVYWAKDDYERAIGAYLEATQNPINDSEDVSETAAIEGNIANALVALSRTEEAHLFLDRAERVLREAQEDIWLGDRLETRARAYLLEGKHREALDAAKEAFDLHWHAFSTESLKQSIHTLAMCFEAYERATMRAETI